VDRRYRTLSVVASNVAAAAALAAQHDEQFAPSRRGSKLPQSSRETFFESPMTREEDDHTEGDFSALSDSVHSEGGLTFGGKKRVSWSRERQGETLTRSLILPASHSEDAADSSARGRTLQRDTSGEVNRVLPSVSVGRSSRISKRSPSMVFLGVFAIFGLGSLFSPKHVTSLSSKIGSVLVPRVTDTSYSAEHSTVNILSIFSNDNDDNNFLIPSSGIPAFEPKVIENSNERVIGHIFAWACTTLYLTSRLPQIWKNYVRKSVEVRPVLCICQADNSLC
jgi:solute carrier family 66 (lysosomal lysine-arginine transporter), member 1